MRVIALTGTIAAGKSSVAAIFRQLGATVIDADAIVRALQRPGEPVLAAIVDRFGPSILRPDGELDRGALRHIMLAETANRHALEAIVHPAVEQRRQALLAEAEARGDQLVIVDIPLLFEAADPTAYDGVVVVDAPREERRRRLIEDRQLGHADADGLLDAQLPAEHKRRAATWVIDNDADRATLTARTTKVWQALAG